MMKFVNNYIRTHGTGDHVEIAKAVVKQLDVKLDNRPIWIITKNSGEEEEWRQRATASIESFYEYFSNRFMEVGHGCFADIAEIRIENRKLIKRRGFKGEGITLEQQLAQDKAYLAECCDM